MKRMIANMKLNRELKTQKKRQKKRHYFSNFDNSLLIFVLLIAGIAYYLYEGEITQKKLIISSQIILFALILKLIFTNLKLKKSLERQEKFQDLRDAKLVTYIEDKQKKDKSQITHMILKNDEGYDVKTWKIGKSNSLILGKSTKLRVDIDLTGTAYSSLISKKHAILNKTEAGWYLEDLGSINGTGVQKLSDNRKLKVKNAPVKVESGDIVYLATTALLLK